MSITHLEVRRHPLWQEQAATESDSGIRRSARVGLLLIGLGALSLIGAIVLIVLN